MECNPNMIEILGCKPEHYLYLDKFGQKVLDHRRDFLSVRAISTFGGYADQQYDRLEHGLLGNGDNDDKKLKMLRDSLDRSIKAFEVAHKSLNMNFSIREVDDNELYRIYPDRERTDKVSNDHLLVSGSFTDIPVTDFKNVISGLHKIQSEYGNINKRNTKKTDEKLAKHMMHLIRLYLMGFDLCTKGEIVTYREKEHDMLMDVRNGKYMTSDGRKVIPEFYELLEDVQSKYEYAIKNCILPEKPNREALNELVIQIVKEKFSM
jgi:hypothetical protein